MCPKDVNDYLEKGLYGSPQIKPEEKKKYLGTYRERVFLAVTLDEMMGKDTHSLVQTELKNNPGHQLLLNSKLDSTKQQSYMVLAKKMQTDFKIVNTEQEKPTSDIGLVYSTDCAVDLPDISLNRLRPVSPSIENPTEETPSLFQKIWKKIKAQ